MPDYTPYPVELVTPEGVAFEGDAQMLVAPGAAGQLGVLANHAPLVSLLDAGRGADHRRRGRCTAFAVDDGFLQVRENRALVLVGEAVAADGIDAGRGPRAAGGGPGGAGGGRRGRRRQRAPRAGLRRGAGRRQRIA